ncbi:hypothetical protein ACWDUL_08870 [Nocardia niigatensis]
MTALEAEAALTQTSRTVVEGNFYDCPEGLVVAPDCLGQRYPTVIDGHSVTVLLPAADTDDPSGSLPELRALDWRYSYPAPAQADPWGMVISADRSGWVAALVLRLAFRFEADGSAEDLARMCGEVEAGLKTWWPLLTTWIDIFSELDLLDHDRLHCSARIQRVALSAFSGEQPGDPANRLNWSRPTEVILVPVEVEIPDSAVLDRCFRLAGEGATPPPGWMYLREARSWLKAGQTRRAVIDACTGAEIALSYQVRQHATADPIVVDQLLDQCKGITELAKVLDKIGGKTASRNSITEKLGNVRNKAVHAGWEPDEEVARNALAVAEKVVDFAWPLSTLGQDAPVDEGDTD